MPVEKSCKRYYSLPERRSLGEGMYARYCCDWGRLDREYLLVLRVRTVA